MNVAPAVNVAQTGNVAPISARRLSVLMVTGAYYPELSGGGLQARAVVHALQDVASFTVLTTSTDRSLPSESDENGVRIHRIHVDVDSIVSQLTAAIRLTLRLARLLPRVDLVNVHGFSRKTILIATLARLFRRPFVLTLQTAGHDEPAGVRALGAVAYRAYAGADLYLSVSPGLSHAFVEAGLPAARLRQVCNAIDIQRFRPPATGERAELRAELGLPVEAPIVLFVGFFSRDKRPDLAYDAWSSATDADATSLLMFIGATRSGYAEIDPGLAAGIRDRAAREGLAGRLRFVESTLRIERYFRAADVYVLSSIREGLPIALLEAMASGLACVASRLPGSTDTIIECGVNGLLVTPDNPRELSAAIRSVLADPGQAARLGAAARETIVERYSIERTAPAWLAAYRDAVAGASATPRPA